MFSKFEKETEIAGNNSWNKFKNFIICFYYCVATREYFGREKKTFLFNSGTTNGKIHIKQITFSDEYLITLRNILRKM